MKLRQQHLKFSLLLLLTGLFVGFFFAAQLQATPSHVRLSNPELPYDALRELNQNLLIDQAKAKDALRLTRTEVTTLERSSKVSTKLSSDLSRQLEQQKTIIGLTELSGQGVEVVLADARGGTTADKVITAADLRDVVNALWSGQAEAISIGSERLVETSSIDAVAETILVNNSQVLPPFHLYAIGDPLSLKSKLVDPKGLVELHRRADNAGIQFQWFDRQTLTVSAYSGNLNPRYAKAEVIQ